MNPNIPENKPEANISQGKPDEASPKVAPEAIQKVPEKADAVEDPNWRAFREARKKDRQDKEAAEKRADEKTSEAAALKAAMEAAFGKQEKSDHHRADPSMAYPEEDSEDDRIEKKVRAAIELHNQQSERARQEREQQEYPQRLAQTYPDFNQAIGSENLDYLEYHYPEVANPLKRLPDGYEKWADIYRAVKKFVPNIGNAKKDAARAEANFNKPKSMSATGASQSGETNTNSRLTDDRKQQNWERMQRSMKGLS